MPGIHHMLRPYELLFRGACFFPLTMKVIQMTSSDTEVFIAGLKSD